MSPAFDIYCFQCPILILFLILPLIHVPFVVLIPILHFILLLLFLVPFQILILALVLLFQLLLLFFERVARFQWQQRQDGLGKLRL